MALEREAAAGSGEIGFAFNGKTPRPCAVRDRGLGWGHPSGFGQRRTGGQSAEASG